MARINRVSITLYALLFITLPLTPMAHASKQAGENSATTHITKRVGKKENTATTQKTQKASQETAKKAASKSTAKSKAASSVKKSPITASESAKTHSKHAVSETVSASFTEEYTKRKGYKSHCVKVKNAVSETLVDTHKTKVQKTTKVAMNKLMWQIGKPYRWDGSSPYIGFDYNGLVCYTYKDLVRIRIPRTANEVYHLHDTAPVGRNELKNGDLVFFRTQGHGIVGHVGVYVGNDKSIRLPCTGQEVQVTSLSKDY